MLWVVVAVALVASLALGATRGRDWYAARQTEAANASAVAAAKQLAINFVTVDYTKVDADVARVKAGATGEFLKSYSTSAGDLTKVLVANQTVSTVQRTEAALVSGDQRLGRRARRRGRADQEHRRPQRRDQDLPDAAGPADGRRRVEGGEP